MADTEIEKITEADLSMYILILNNLIKFLMCNLFFVTRLNKMYEF